MSYQNFRIITTEEELNFVISACKKTQYASVDFETTGLKYYSSLEYPLILGISYQPGCAWILPLQHSESPFKKGNKWKKLLKKLSREVLENPSIVKVAWNFKFEIKWFNVLGVFPAFRLLDAMLAKYCLDEERPHDLKSMVSMMFPQYANYELKVKGQNWGSIPLNTLSEYCALDADLTLRIFIYLESRVIKLGFYPLFRNLLMMATRVLAKAEFRGAPIDLDYLNQMVTNYGSKLIVLDKELRQNKKLLKYQLHKSQEIRAKITTTLHEELKEIKNSDRSQGIKTRMINQREGKLKAIQSTPIEPINFISPTQLIDYLFKSEHGLKLKPIKTTKKGKPSTDEESLEALKKKDKSGFMEKLLEFRGISKLYSTYIKGMLPLTDSYGRIHTSFLIHGTVTGRLSSKEPNLQNIPRDTTSSDIKKMFIPPTGFVLLEVDYSQAELRVVAELAKDDVMIDIFKRGYNIHVATACLVNGGLEQYDKVKGLIKIGDSMSGADLAKPENKDYLFWVKQKKRAKLINFGILYGQGPRKLAGELDCTEEEAEQFIGDWLNNYKGVKKWITKQKKFVHENGYVISLFGRKRRLYNIDHPNKRIRLEAERQAVNTPIQGCASDFALFSQVILDEMIMANILPHDTQQVYTVHDSIGFFIRPHEIHKAVPIITEVCNNPKTKKYFGFELSHVRMKVSAEVGENWGSLTEYSETEDYTKLLN